MSFNYTLVFTRVYAARIKSATALSICKM